MLLASDRSTGSLSHTLAHLSRLDLLIWREVLSLRQQQPQHTDNDFRGLYISEEDVDAILGRSLTAAGLLAPALPDEHVAAVNAALAAADARIADLETGPVRQGDVAPLAHLCRV